MRLNSISVILLLCTCLASCSLKIRDWKAIREVSASTSDVLSGNSTRSGFDLKTDRLTFHWTEGDKIGIFPTSEGNSQVALTIKSGAGTNTARFTGGGWALRDDITYVAYYPYNVTGTSDNITFSYDGQHQTGNATLSHLGTHDFMVTPLTYAVNRELDFSFSHLNSIAQLVLTVPDETSFTSVTIRSDYAIFAKTARLNLTGTEYSFEQEDVTDRIVMQLSDVASTVQDKTLTLYMNLFPMDMSGHSIKVTMQGSNNRIYEGILLSKTLEAGRAYSFAATLADVTMDVSINSPSFGDNSNEI